MISGDGEEGQPEAAEEARRPLVLVTTAAVRQIAARDDQLRPRALDQAGERLLDVRILACARVQIGEVEDPRRHRCQQATELHWMHG